MIRAALHIFDATLPVFFIACCTAVPSQGANMVSDHYEFKELSTKGALRATFPTLLRFVYFQHHTCPVAVYVWVDADGH